MIDAGSPPSDVLKREKLVYVVQDRSMRTSLNWSNLIVLYLFNNGFKPLRVGDTWAEQTWRFDPTVCSILGQNSYAYNFTVIIDSSVNRGQISLSTLCYLDISIELCRNSLFSAVDFGRMGWNLCLVHVRVAHSMRWKRWNIGSKGWIFTRILYAFGSKKSSALLFCHLPSQFKRSKS